MISSFHLYNLCDGDDFKMSTTELQLNFWYKHIYTLISNETNFLQLWFIWFSPHQWHNLSPPRLSPSLSISLLSLFLSPCLSLCVFSPRYLSVRLWVCICVLPWYRSVVSYWWSDFGSLSIHHAYISVWLARMWSAPAFIESMLCCFLFTECFVQFPSLHSDGLVQERRNSSADALELRLRCTNPSIQSSL